MINICIYPIMEQNIVFIVSISIALFFIVGETITEKLPTQKFSIWWRKNVVSEEQNSGDKDC